MTINIEEYNRLKKKVEQQKAAADRAQGVIDQCLKELKESYDCDSLEEAEKLLKQTTAEREDIEKKYNEAKAKFIEQWGDKLA